MKSEKPFLLVAGITFLTLCALSAIIFAIIDPRCLFHIKIIPGFNEKKFSFFMNESFIKPYQILQKKPSVIITGNSIANTAFDPEHPLFEGSRFYSYGVAGAGIYTNLRLLQHIEDMPYKKVIHVVDFSSFFITNTMNQRPFIEKTDVGKRLRYTFSGEPNPNHFLQKIKDYGLLLLSWEIAAESLETVTRQKDDGWFLQADGTWGGGSSQAGKPQRKRFTYVEKEIFMLPLKNLDSSQPFYGDIDAENTMAYMETYLDILYKKNVDVVLVIPPSHARVYETLFIQSRWDDYRKWKKNTLEINAKSAKNHNRKIAPVWDFSGYNTLTTETIPALDDKTSRMQWFYDSVHIKPAVGNKMLDIMHGFDTSDSTPSVLLTPENVDQQLQEMQQGHIDYQHQHPTDVAEVFRLCQSVYQDTGKCRQQISGAQP